MPKSFVRPAPPVESRTPAPPPPPDITFDDVEDEPWFLRLPPAAQEEMRARWRADDARGVRRRSFATATRTRSIVQASLVYLFTETCAASPSVMHSLAAIASGVIVGIHWHRIGAGRFRCMLTSIWPFVTMRLVFALTDTSVGLAATCIWAVLGFVVLMALTATVGFLREFRRADDLEY